MTTWTVFHTGTPGLPNETDGPIAVSTGFQINDGGTYWCTGIEFFAATTPPTGVVVTLYERNTDESFGATPGATLATRAAPGAITGGVRNQILFTTPVPVTAALFPNGMYATMRTANNYVASAGTFSGGGLTNGPITAYQAGSPGSNGRFKTTGPPTDATNSYPNTQFGGNGYWVSPIITDVDPSGAPVTVVDLPGTGQAGGSPDTPLAGSVIPDLPGGSAAGGSPATVTAAVQVNDSGSGAQAGGSPSGTAGDLSVLDTPGGALAAGSPAVISTGEPIVITDLPGGAAAGGAAETVVASTAQPDLAVYPLLLQALACLEAQVGTLESPPRYVQLRPGVAFTAGLSQMEDECCEGSAWIRVVNIVPTDDFPTPRTGPGNCQPMALAVDLELGILRCAPTRSDVNADEIVRGVQWSEAVRLTMNDAAALRRTACCIAALVDNYTIGTWSPQQVEANCMGGTMSMTIQAPACDFTCG